MIDNVYVSKIQCYLVEQPCGEWTSDALKCCLRRQFTVIGTEQHRVAVRLCLAV